MSIPTRKTDRKPSMPPRGKRPGFKVGRNSLPYWYAKQVMRQVPADFPDHLRPLPPDATDEQIAALCQDYTAELRDFMANEPAEPKLAKTRYDGTMRSASRIYQEHKLSDFHDVKFTTKKAYLTCLRRIEATVGNRRIRNLTKADFKNWYKQWRKPEVKIANDGTPVVGNERIDRAHDTIAMVRTVIYFLESIGNEDAIKPATILGKIKFEKGAAREGELTYRHVSDFVRSAFDLARRGIIPQERALAMSIGVTAQFELLLRQMDIIGEWADVAAVRRLPAGIATFDLPAIAPQERWAGFFTWEKIAGWRWRMKTSKSKYRAANDFDLTRYSLLHPLLEMVPLHARQGAIVRGEHGLPVRQRSYYNWFRDIAEVAGIPSDVWNMDARAGGAGEADDAGATIEEIRDGLTHTNTATTVRYIHRRGAKHRALADKRSAKRAAENDGGTG